MDKLSRVDSRGSASTRSSTASPVESEDPVRSFEFINLTTAGPPSRDVGQRRVVRAHVVKDFSRKRKLQRLQAEKLKGRKLQPSLPTNPQQIQVAPKPALHPTLSTQPAQPKVEENQASSSQNLNSLPTRAEEESYDPLEDPSPILDPHPDLFDHAFSISGLGGVTFQALEPDRALSSVVRHVRDMGTAMFPLSTMYKFNPVCCNGPIGWDVDDRAAYHGIMYVTSTYANLLSGRTESNDAMMHMGKVVTMVNSRLREIGLIGGGAGVTEGLIGAVASIALAEALRGNLEGWKIHMSGVKHLVMLRGDMSTLSLDLRHKLFRADLMGATTFLQPPSFSGVDTPAWRLSAEEINNVPGTIINSPHALLSGLTICRDLGIAFLSLANLSTTLSQILAVKEPCPKEQRVQVLEQTYSIQYYLLRNLSHGKDAEMSSVEECLRVAGLLYMHVTWQDFPLSAMGVTKLLGRLRELVAHTDFDGDAEEHLLVWLLFVGAIAAKKGNVKIWFIANIQKLLVSLRLDGWETIRNKLSCLWWVGKVHEKLCKSAYDEVTVLNSVLGGGFTEEITMD